MASLRSLLEYDTTDCVKNPACLLPADALTASEMARRNAYRFVPRYDEDVQAVTAPTIPAPFVNPPIVLRSHALMAGSGVFADDFRYCEAMNMKSLVERASCPRCDPCRKGRRVAGRAAGQPERRRGRPLKFERQVRRWSTDRASRAKARAKRLALPAIRSTSLVCPIAGRPCAPRCKGHPGYRPPRDGGDGGRRARARNAANTLHFGTSRRPPGWASGRARCAKRPGSAW